jgi:hypothetical protein
VVVDLVLMAQVVNLVAVEVVVITQPHLIPLVVVQYLGVVQAVKGVVMWAVLQHRLPVVLRVLIPQVLVVLRVLTAPLQQVVRQEQVELVLVREMEVVAVVELQHQIPQELKVEMVEYLVEAEGVEDVPLQQVRVGTVEMVVEEK